MVLVQAVQLRVGERIDPGSRAGLHARHVLRGGHARVQGPGAARGIGPVRIGIGTQALAVERHQPARGQRQHGGGIPARGDEALRRELRSPETSTTAAALASEQATKSVLRSALSDSAEGVMPSGWRGVVATLMLSRILSSLPAPTPTEYTLLVLEAATKSRAA